MSPFGSDSARGLEGIRGRGSATGGSATKGRNLDGVSHGRGERARGRPHRVAEGEGPALERGCQLCDSRTRLSVLVASGLNVDTLRKSQWVAERVPVGLRSPSLSWSHHKVIAPLDEDAQVALLAKAAEHEMSVSALTDAVRTYKHALTNGGEPPEEVVPHGTSSTEPGRGCGGPDPTEAGSVRGQSPGHRLRLRRSGVWSGETRVTTGTCSSKLRP